MRKINHWTKEEEEFLAKTYPSVFPQEISLLFPNRSIGSVKQRANDLHICHGERKIYFPKNYDNVSDGNYISGLVDGEGSFMVSVVNRRNRWNFNPKFGIYMRADEKEILLWMKEYFGCGHYHELLKRKSPMAGFVVCDLYNIMSKIIPHFDKFNLRAKKRFDYIIWKEMIEIQAKYFRLPWKDETRDKMKLLYESLKSGRLYNGNKQG